MSSSSTGTIGAIAGKELRSFLGNPTGYVFLTRFIVASAAAAFLTDTFFGRNLADLATLDRWIPAILMFFVPAITMNLWADERRSGTDELLLTLPVRDTEVVLGKFFGALGVYTVGLLFSLANVVVLAYLGEPDGGLMFATYFGYWLMGPHSTVLLVNTPGAGTINSAGEPRRMQFGLKLLYNRVALPGPTHIQAPVRQHRVKRLAVTGCVGVMTQPGAEHIASQHLHLVGVKAAISSAERDPPEPLLLRTGVGHIYIGWVPKFEFLHALASGHSLFCQHGLLRGVEIGGFPGMVTAMALLLEFMDQCRGGIHVRQARQIVHIQAAQAEFFVVWAGEDENNHYFRTVGDSTVWEAFCGAEAYEKMREYTGYNIRRWIDSNVNWEEDLDNATSSHLRDNQLLGYLNW